MQIDIVGFLGQLPVHMLATLCFFDNAHGALVPQDLTALEIGCPSFLTHLHRCAEVCNLLTMVLSSGPEHKKPHIAIQDWPSVQVDFLLELCDLFSWFS
jgi:hypothetical protein